MCRSIKVLRRPDESATREEMDAAALQFVRKISGFHKPSMANQGAFEQAIAEIASASERLLQSIGAASAAKRPHSHLSADAGSNPPARRAGANPARIAKPVSASTAMAKTGASKDPAP